MVIPSQYKPASIDDFIGETRAIGKTLAAKAARLKADPKGRLALLFYGPAGVGKSELAMMLAITLAEHPLAVQQVNGQSLSVDKVRDWEQEAHFGLLLGKFRVKVVDEYDKGSEAAKTELLTFLDQRHSRTAVICTTNVSLKDIPKREASRMQPWKFKPVPTEQIAHLITSNWRLPKDAALTIAGANDGDVRGSLNEAEKYLDRLEAA